jgi:hypothetical protein
MIGGIVKKIRNAFHIPGEDVTLIAFDDRGRSVRVYDMWTKTANKFDNRLEGKTIEGNVAQPLLTYKRTRLSTAMGWVDSILDKIMPGAIEPIATSEQDETNKDVMHIYINKKYSHIFKTNDKPEGIAYLVDMQTGQGVQLIPKQINLERDPVLDMLCSTNPFFWGSTIDSFIATELLRGKVEWWKTLLFMGMALVLGLIFGMGM